MKALILAGGENKRLPVIKGFLEIEDRRIIESNIELLNGIFDCVIISTNNPECYFYLGVPMVGDIAKYRGPMTGILSALVSLEAPELFVTACDMPFIKPELIRYIVDKWAESWDAVIPIFDNKPQPLFGIYSKKLVKEMENNIRRGIRSLGEFLKKIDVLYISEEEVRAIDPDGRSFVNINTLEDFEKEMRAKQARLI
ncbi:MAG: molybdenum cofactor guanylyltransferase [Thermodesulfovibrionales bacterium]|nr:molybdenum cofactor guanylyltransferase [Thermodesulfovibrionales bacterium]